MCRTSECRNPTPPFNHRIGISPRFCDKCIEDDEEVICDCQQDYIYMDHQCAKCWVEAQQKKTPPTDQKRRHAVAKMSSRPPEPKQRRVEAVIDISEEDIIRPPIVPITLDQMFPRIGHLMRAYAVRYPSDQCGVPPTSELNKVKCTREGCEKVNEERSGYCRAHTEEEWGKAVAALPEDDSIKVSLFNPSVGVKTL